MGILVNAKCDGIYINIIMTGHKDYYMHDLGTTFSDFIERASAALGISIGQLYKRKVVQVDFAADIRMNHEDVWKSLVINRRRGNTGALLGNRIHSTRYTHRKRATDLMLAVYDVGNRHPERYCEGDGVFTRIELRNALKPRINFDDLPLYSPPPLIQPARWRFVRVRKPRSKNSKIQRRYESFLKVAMECRGYLGMAVAQLRRRDPNHNFARDFRQIISENDQISRALEEAHEIHSTSWRKWCES